MTEYKENEWVEVSWNKVYPKFKGKVKFYTIDQVCVDYHGLGRLVPQETVKKCTAPKKKK